MEIKAFKAHRFNSNVTGEIGKCISPPYDVIDSAQQESLYNQNPYNIARIIKGKKNADDNDSQNQYTRAADYLKDWIEKGALQQDDKEAVYGYVQNFDIDGQNYCRSGFVALGKLAEFGSGVQPHEKTLDGPKADRLNLTRATAAQFGQIFMLFDDAKQVADKIIAAAVKNDVPALDFTDDENVRHRLFVIDEPQNVKAITEMLSDKEALIADGHHRYETALNYYRETKKPNAQYRMMTFVNMRNEGLVVLPTHRLVGNIKDFDADLMIKKLQSDFKITEFTYSADSKDKAKGLMLKRLEKAFGEGKNAFGIYDGTKFYFISLVNKKGQQDLPCSNASKSLDVVVLHKLILENLLEIGDAQLAGQSNIEYIKDINNAVDEAIAKVDSGQMQVLFLTNPTKVEQVRAVAAENEKMPQKSTFFYPKIFTGLTINKL